MTRLTGAPARLQGLLEALLAAATAWFAVLSWRGLVEEPDRVTTALLWGALLVVGVGWVMRMLTARWYVVLPVQLVVALLWVQERVTGTWLPGAGDVQVVLGQLAEGSAAGQRFVSPVPAEYPQFAYVLLLGGLGIVLAVDLVACTLRRAPLAGLPLLLTLTVSASLLLQPITAAIFLAAAATWLLLIALQAGEELVGWGDSGAPDGEGRRSLTATTTTIGLACAVLAVVVTSTLSAEGRQLGDIGQGPGAGSIATTNPLLDLRRNLRQSDSGPLVQVRTSQGSPAYLRTTVLDEFTGSVWRPSRRTASSTEPVDEVLAPAPGLEAGAEGPQRRWSVRVAQSFATRWLPVPFPTSELSVGGGWRYDPDTLDVVATGDTSAAGRSYTLTTTPVRVDADALRIAGPAPAEVREPMTRLPQDLPDTFARTAQRVTAGAATDFDRAVALQDWFRSDGGFRYSTAPAPGSGIRTLERFVTTDRVGYCEQFSTAMAVMARSLGIPARVSVGFLRPERSGQDYVFDARDLHAWPELYFNGVGWLRFEPTPAARTQAAPDYTRQEQVDAATPQTLPSTQPSAQPAPAVPSTAPQTSGSGDQPERDGGAGWVLWPLGLVLLGLLLALPRGLRELVRRRRWAGAHSPGDRAEVAWREVRDTAVDLGLPWLEDGTVRQNAAAVHRTLEVSEEAERSLSEVVSFVEVTRYARPGAGPGSVATVVGSRRGVEDEVHAWREELVTSLGSRRARRSTWWPRSLVDRPRRTR